MSWFLGHRFSSVPDHLCVPAAPPFSSWRYLSTLRTPLVCNKNSKFAPLFSTTSTMLLPQPLSFQTFALLPGVAWVFFVLHFHFSVFRLR